MASEDQIHLLKPAWRKNFSCSLALLVLLGSRTHFLYNMVLPYSMKELIKSLLVPLEIPFASEMLSRVHALPINLKIREEEVGG